MLKIVSTTPYSDQKMGTAGLRRKSKVVIQPNYIENFLQSIFNTIGDLSGHTYIVGGDGRFYNDVAIQKFIKMAAANGIHKLIIGQNGLLSTPASSNLILKNKTDGGFIFSASHNPGGENGDFGVKYATASGGQAPSSLSDAIYQNTLTIKEYKIMDVADIDLSKIGSSCGSIFFIPFSIIDFVISLQNSVNLTLCAASCISPVTATLKKEKAPSLS